MTKLEDIRTLIGREVARQRPREEARATVALLAETELDITDGGEVIRRHASDGNRPDPASPGDEEALHRIVRGVVTDLRARHPTLFDGAPPQDAEGEWQDRDAAVPPPGTPRGEEQRGARDWLMLAPALAGQAPQGATTKALQARTAQERPSEPRPNAAAPTRPAAPPPAEGLRPAVHASALRAPGAGLMALAAGALVVTLGAAYLLAPAANAPDRVAAGEPPEPEATGALPPAAAIAVPPRQAVPAGATALSGVPEVIDTITLRLRGEVVRLFAVEWDRGAQAEDLTAYIAGREVTCEPVGSTNTHRCTVDGRDLSQVVLYNGGGKAGPDATPVLREAEARARAEKVGVWR